MEAASLVAGFPFVEPLGLVSWSLFLLVALFRFWCFLVLWLVFFLLLVGFLPCCLWSQGWVGSSWCCGGGLCGCRREGWGRGPFSSPAEGLGVLQDEVFSVWVGWVKG